MTRKNNYHLCASLVVILFNIVFLQAMGQNQPFKGFFYDKTEKVELHLNLYEASLTVPGMSFLGKVHGYMQGNIYGVWMLTKFKANEKKATLRFSNDLGGDSQTIKLTIVNDSIIKYKAVDGNHVKRINKRKLVKIPDELYFTRIM